MWFRYNKRFVAKILVLLVIFIFAGVVGAGCTGQVARGWSGGVVADGTLYVGSMDGELLAVNVANGSRPWTMPLETEKKGGGACAAPATPPAIYGTPAVGEGLVFVASYSGKIYAYNSTSGALRWVYPRIGDFDVPIIGGPVVSEGVVYVGVADGKVYAFDAATGDKMWEFQTGDKIWSSPAILDNILFIASFDKKLYAVETASGAKIWEFETSGVLIAEPLVHNGVVYVGSFDRYLYALDATSGNLKWEFMGEKGFWVKPVILNDVIYAPSLDGKVYAIDAQNGNKIVEFNLDSPVSSSPVLVGELVIVATQNGQVYAIDTTSNEQRRLVDLRELANRTKLTINAPLTEGNGSIFVHTQGYEAIYALNAETGAQLWSPIILD